MIWVCGTIIELDLLERVAWVVQCVGDSKLGSCVSNRKCSHQCGLGDVVVSGAQVEVAADRKGTGDHPAPVVGYFQRSEGGIGAATACCVSIGSAACAG